MIKLEAWPEGNYSPHDKPYPRGEIIIGGNTVGHGYYKMPEKTKEDFSTDENGIRWFRTGDIGMMDENGQLVIIGKLLSGIFPNLDLKSLDCRASKIISKRDRTNFLEKSTFQVLRRHLGRHSLVFFHIFIGKT